jgi:hypothetical protein
VNNTNDDHASSTNKGIWEALSTTSTSMSGQQPTESSASFETRLGAFNNERAAAAPKKGS